MPIPFLAQEISGLADPTYASGGANKSYVDAISGAITTWATDAFPASANYLTEIEADALYAPSGTGESTGSGAVTLSSGLISDASIFHVGAATEAYLNDIPQSVIKSGANWQKAYMSAQSALYSETYGDEASLTAVLDDNYAPSTAAHGLYAPSSAYNAHVADTAKHYTSGSMKNWTDLLYTKKASGANWEKAYQSSQLLKDGAFQSFATGWFHASDQSLIPHTLGAVPDHVTITPSGAITFATAYTADATNITLRMSCAGQHTVNWRAEV